jgi:Zn-dependent protease
MLFSILSGGDVRSIIINLLLTIPVILMALSFHEAAHALIAYKLGDRTAYNLGRVTMNPLKHLDPFGCLWMLVFGYGWAKPVPINPRNFKDPRKGMAYTAIAGPTANLILGLIGAILYAVTNFIAVKNYWFLVESGNEMLLRIVQMLLMFLYYLAVMNFTFMIFNLIPVPPFDGSRFFGLFLPPRVYFAVMKYERYTLIAVLVLSFLCSRFFGFSPAFWVAEKMFNLAYEGISRALLAIFA